MLYKSATTVPLYFNQHIWEVYYDDPIWELELEDLGEDWFRHGKHVVKWDGRVVRATAKQAATLRQMHGE